MWVGIRKTHWEWQTRLAENGPAGRVKTSFDIRVRLRNGGRPSRGRQVSIQDAQAFHQYLHQGVDHVCME